MIAILTQILVLIVNLGITDAQNPIPLVQNVTNQYAAPYVASNLESASNWMSQQSAIQPVPPATPPPIAMGPADATIPPTALFDFNQTVNSLAFEPTITRFPDGQLEIKRKTLHANFEMFKKILREAIDKRTHLGSGVKIQLKYSGKILSRFVADYLHEKQLRPRYEEKPEFHSMLSDWIQTIVKRSADIMRKLDTTTVNYEDMYRRFSDTLDYVEKLINLSPVGAYLTWPKVVLFEDEPTKAKKLEDELSDLLAVSIDHNSNIH